MPDLAPAEGGDFYFVDAADVEESWVTATTARCTVTCAARARWTASKCVGSGRLRTREMP
jgi:hypothetical protein